MVLNKEDERTCNGFGWLRIGTTQQAAVNMVVILSGPSCVVNFMTS
jgi:hypothetical protein